MPDGAPVARSVRAGAAVATVAAAIFACGGTGPAWAQGAPEFPLGSPVSPLLTLDQDRLFAESLYGRRVARELDRASEALAAENRRLEAELGAEERALTERRPELPAAEFRALADAFDDKVTQTRSEQDAKARALQRRADTERQTFLNRVLPILAELVSERGAFAILDNRAVLLASEAMDITEDALARIDAVLGDGGDLAPSEPAEGAPAGEEPAAAGQNGNGPGPREE